MNIKSHLKITLENFPFIYYLNNNTEYLYDFISNSTNNLIIKLNIENHILLYIRTYFNDLYIEYTSDSENSEAIFKKIVEQNTIFALNLPIKHMKIYIKQGNSYIYYGFLIYFLYKDKENSLLKPILDSNSQSIINILSNKDDFLIKISGDDVINTRKISTITKNTYISCPICLDSYKKKAFIYPCRHFFCYKCICKWSRSSTTCPICKAFFTQIKIGDRTKRTFLRPKGFAYDPYEDDSENTQWYNNLIDHCVICKEKDDEYLMLVCDKCNKNIAHYYCDNLDRIPYDKWYCPECRREE